MGRGPSYPYIGLEDSIEMAQKMYAFAKKAPAPTDAVIAEAWKYSPTSSSGIKVLAALKAFGLVEDAPGGNGKSIKLTSRTIRIMLDDDQSAERREEIRKAALSPKWYEYCWKTWGKETPPSMKSRLLVDHGFVDTTVEGFLRDYKKTIAFAGLLDEVTSGEKKEGEEESKLRHKIGDYVQWESQGVLQMPEAKRISAFLDDGKYATIEGSSNPVPVAELVASEPPDPKTPQNIFIPATHKFVGSREIKMQTETFALPEGVTGQLQWPSEMSPEAYEDFVYQLEGLKRRVNRSVRKDTGAPSAVPSEDAG
jgi:hypothetical protein